MKDAESHGGENMKYGLIGEKLGHSWSCEIHSLIPEDYEYELKELAPDEVGAFVSSRDFRAFNVTIPYKKTVIPFLDHLSEEATLTGSVNTVVNRGGVLYGYNTDVYGLTAQLLRDGNPIRGKAAFVLGTGGVSKSAAEAAKRAGAESVTFVSRAKKEGVVTYAELLARAGGVEYIVNCTPAGMYPRNGESPVNVADFPNLCGVTDLIYNPLRTKLVRQARALGLPAQNGLYMLCAQAVKAASLFFDRAFDPALAGAIRDKLTSEKENIVLIGMPASGKTTVGQLLARRLGRAFIDTDDGIVERAGKSIPDIFAQDGEAAFRQIESDVIREAGAKTGAVVATGGGAILRPENVTALKQNGKVVFLDRAPEKLSPGTGRPLFADPQQAFQLYEKRHPLYRAAADITVDANGTVEETAEQIHP